jgi:hypothetical protein
MRPVDALPGMGQYRVARARRQCVAASPYDIDVGWVRANVHQDPRIPREEPCTMLVLNPVTGTTDVDPP